MGCYHLLKISKSTKSGKKMMALFEDCHTNRQKTVHFGAAGMSDYTLHKDSERKASYLSRHGSNEKWEDYTTAGSLSRWILWNKPTLSASIADYKRRFKL